MIKARIYDEAVAKIGGVTTLKLIHICVDYSTRMETILVEMRVLFNSRNRFFRGSPIPLEKFLDLTDFLDLLPVDLLQNLQTPTTLRTTRGSAEFGGRPAPGSNAKTSEADRPQQESPVPALRPESAPIPEPASTPALGSTSVPIPEPVPTPEAQGSVPMDTTQTPPLPINPASVVPSPPTNSPTASDPRPKAPPPAPMPPLAETAREYMESVRRQVAFTHTPDFKSC